MKNVIDLTNKMDNDQLQKLSYLHTKWAKRYYEFLLKYIKNDTIKDRMKHALNNTTEFFVEVGTTIPRTRDCRDASCPMPPHTSGVYVVQDITTNLESDGKKYGTITPAIALLYDRLKWPDTFLHEITHVFSELLKFLSEENAVYKFGLSYSVRESNMFQSKSGNWLNEGLTDALASIFFDENYDEIVEDFGVKIINPSKKKTYASGYDSHLPMKIMLLDMSNELLINAYFGEKEDLRAFADDFDEVMKNENITFEELNKINNDDNSANPDKLLYYACRYALYKCKTKEARKKKIEEFKEILKYKPSIQQQLFDEIVN